MSNLWRIGAFAIGLLLIAIAAIISVSQTPDVPSPVVLPAPERQVEILVATEKLDTGTLLTADKTRWMQVPESAATSGEFIKSGGDAGMEAYLGRLIVESVDKDKPILPRHIAQSVSSNYIARLLRPGQRAFAISIDNKGTATAGNLILPNDHVDIIRSFNSIAGLQSEVILTHIRVLAIGQTVQGDGLSSAGDTATVEVDVQGAQLLATAQRTGQLSLALRHPQDGDASALAMPSIQVIRATPPSDKQP